MTPIPQQARIITVQGTAASGLVEQVEISGVPFLRVGVNGEAVLIQLNHIVEIRPLSYGDTTWESVIECVADTFEVEPEDITKGHSKLERYTRPRFCAWYVALQLGVDGYSGLGRRTKYNHAAVMHGIKRARDLMDTDPVFRSRVGRVLANFQAESAR